MTQKSPIKGKTVEQARRSVEAAARKAARDARTAEEQLALLDTRPGNAIRERNSLKEAS